MEKSKDVKKGDCMMKQRRTKNKYFIWFLLSLAWMLIGTTGQAKAGLDVKQKGDCYYRDFERYLFLENRTVYGIEIVGIRKGVKNPHIPDKINGKKVRSIYLMVDEEDGVEAEYNIDTLEIPRYADYYSCGVLHEVKVKNFKVHAKNKYYTVRDGCLYSKDKKTLVRYPNGREEKTFTIPNRTAEIGENAFWDSAVEKISMPDSVKVIGDCAFGWTKLKSIQLSSKLKSIESEAFAKTDLKKIVFPKSLKTIGSSTFSGCKKLKSVTIPKKNHLQTIGEYAFYRCHRLRKFIYPEPIEVSRYIDMGEGVFRGCIRLEKVKLPAGIGLIENRCFYNCKSLKEIHLKGVGIVEDYAFYKCSSLQKVTLGDKWTVDIREGAFQKCGKLKEIRIASKAKVGIYYDEDGYPQWEGYIDEEAFAKKGKKKKLTIIAPKGSCAYNYAKKHKKQGLKVKELK